MKINKIQKRQSITIKDLISKLILNVDCGEIPLSAPDSCRLIAINLYSYIDNPYTNKAEFNKEKFIKYVKWCTKYADDIIDLECEKIDAIISKLESEPTDNSREINLWNRIRTSAIKGRRVGIGITAEADMLAAMNLKYGTDEACIFSENIHRLLASIVYAESFKLGAERGKFEIYNRALEINNPFIQRMCKELDLNSIPRRNIALLTVAPTGSLSTMTQTSSGVEPVFLLEYNRRRKVDKDTLLAIKDDKGEYWQTYKVFHHKLLIWFKINYPNESVENINKYIHLSPYYNSTSDKIDHNKKIEMQGKINQWVDHSISITHNIVNSSTPEDISNIYFKAWECGCKGATIYREGSRDAILSKIDTSKTDRVVPKRPKSLKCDIHHVTVKGNSWIVIIGLNENETNELVPYEIFAFKKKNISISPKITTGVLTRIKSGIYNLELDSIILENVVDLFDKDEEEALTRMLSLILRHNQVPITFIVDQLNKAEGTIVSFSKAIARTLKKYIVDDKYIKKEKCPICNSNEFIFIEGCLKCKECGWSKC